MVCMICLTQNLNKTSSCIYGVISLEKPYRVYHFKGKTMEIKVSDLVNTDIVLLQTF